MLPSDFAIDVAILNAADPITLKPIRCSPRQDRSRPWRAGRRPAAPRACADLRRCELRRGEATGFGRGRGGTAEEAHRRRAATDSRPTETPVSSALTGAGGTAISSVRVMFVPQSARRRCKRPASASAAATALVLVVGEPHDAEAGRSQARMKAGAIVAPPPHGSSTE